MIEAILLDMDGVIVDSEPIRKKVHTTLAEEFNYKLKKEDWIFMRGKTAKDVCTYLIKKYTPKTPYDFFIKRKDAILDSMIDQIKVFPGFKNFMKIIKDYKVAVASSSTRRNVEKILNLCKIKSYFHIIVSGTDVNNGKPHPEPFLKAASLLNVNPKNCLVIEDAVNGVKAAKAAGMKVIAVTTSHDKKELQKADLITKDIGSITKEMLDAIGEKCAE